ncbi:AraC family transcriptional regulator [Desulfovibrio intestinalis]|uniref:AraC-like DNA-binding protein n=1 Tax=Desulfovibrio intestinalis TaxID=58621 RepID=A0A7W8C0W6_9BACT|nr:helix-turn-helix transcriptional regulator [Desulfovibrio intestinalis]MBB5142813.1 AraC-like DNA-binding protein [Desulfovibrio intestinalis]
MRHHTPIAVQTFAAPQSLPFVEVRTTLGSVQPYAEHFHSSLSLGMILEGRTRFKLHGQLHSQTHEAKEGDLVLIGPGVPHSCNPVGTQCRSYHMAHVDSRWFVQNVCPVLALPEDYEVALPLICDRALFACALNIVQAVVDGQESSEQALQAFLVKLQSEYHCFKAATKHSSITAQFLPEEEEDSLDTERHAVAQLAKKSGLCRESYSRAFRRGAGLPPGSYLHCLRLEKARRLLRQGKSIADAAVAVGYADQSHLHRMFVKFYSVTPGCYRRGGSHSYKK